MGRRTDRIAEVGAGFPGANPSYSSPNQASPAPLARLFLRASQSEERHHANCSSRGDCRYRHRRCLVALGLIRCKAGRRGSGSCRCNPAGHVFTRSPSRSAGLRRQLRILPRHRCRGAGGDCTTAHPQDLRTEPPRRHGFRSGSSQRGACPSLALRKHASGAGAHRPGVGRDHPLRARGSGCKRHSLGSGTGPGCSLAVSLVSVHVAPFRAREDRNEHRPSCARLGSHHQDDPIL